MLNAESTLQIECAVKSDVQQSDRMGLERRKSSLGIKMFKETKRERFILSHGFQSFFAVVESEPDPHVHAFFLLLLYTGARRSNSLAMRWDQIDWRLRFWRIPLTKSGEPQTIPLTDEAIKVLRALKKRITILLRGHSQVLPALPVILWSRKKLGSGY